MRRRDFTSRHWCRDYVATRARSPPPATSEDERIAFFTRVRNQPITGAAHRNTRRFEELSRLGYVEGQPSSLQRTPGKGTRTYGGTSRDSVNTHLDLILAWRSSIVRFQMATTDNPDCDRWSWIRLPLGLGYSTRDRAATSLSLLSLRIGNYLKRWDSVEAMPKLSHRRYLTSRRFWEDPSWAASRLGANGRGSRCRPAMLVNFDDPDDQLRFFRAMEQDEGCVHDV